MYSFIPGLNFPQQHSLTLTQAKISEKLVATAVEKFGKLDGVCLNAGIFGPCFSMAESSVEDWAKGLHINVLSHLSTVSYTLAIPSSIISRCLVPRLFVSNIRFNFS